MPLAVHFKIRPKAHAYSRIGSKISYSKAIKEHICKNCGNLIRKE
jgi:hypothetical protein